MFDKILEVLSQCVSWFVPFVIIEEFERGVVLRLGRFNRELAPGFHWIIPLQIEHVLQDNVVPRTLNLKPQSLTTKDGKSVVVSGVVTAFIRDIRKSMLEVESVDNALEDSCYGAIAVLVAANEWQTVQQEEFSDLLTKSCRRQAFKYGMEITRVQLSDVATSRALRIYMN